MGGNSASEVTLEVVSFHMSKDNGASMYSMFRWIERLQPIVGTVHEH